jgi:hypothetical protein
MALMNIECPKEITEKDCPLRKYLNSDQSNFRISINETLLVPKTNNWDELGKSFVEMQKICQGCYAQKQR